MEASKLTVDEILKPTDPTMKKSKIICTLGPACKDIGTLIEMLDAGMNVARLNFSHGDHKSHGVMVQKLKDAK